MGGCAAESGADIAAAGSPRSQSESQQQRPKHRVESARARRGSLVATVVCVCNPSAGFFFRHPFAGGLTLHMYVYIPVQMYTYLG